MTWVIITVLTLIGAMAVLRRRIAQAVRAASARQLAKLTVGGLMLTNGLLAAAFGLVILLGHPAYAQTEAPQQNSAEQATAQTSPQGGSDNTALAAAIAVGVGSLAAGIAVAVVGSAAVGGMAQRPEIFGRSLVFVGLAEGIAIYGLIIAFMILTG